MAKQLVFTSVLRGLDPGRSGYCTVARHRDLRERLIPEIERLSAYHHLNYTTDGRVVNPVVMAFRTLSMGDTRYHVLTRIVDAGADYSRRSNYLAHHLIIEEKELTDGLSPADVFLGWKGWLDNWDGEPRFYGAADEVSLAGLAAGLPPALPAQNWEAMTGDAGAAAAPLDAAPRQGFAFAIRPGSERVLLSLYRESAALLPAGERWKTGFTSYLQETDRQNDFRWAGHWPEHQPFTASGWTVLDLRHAGLVPVPAGPVAARARVAGVAAATAVPARVPASAEAAGGTAKKWDVSKPGGGGRTPASAGSFARQAPPKARRTWPLVVAGLVVLLAAAGGAGYWFVQAKQTEDREARERKRKDAFVGMPVGEKLAGEAPQVAGHPPVVAAPTPAPLPEKKTPEAPAGDVAATVAAPSATPAAAVPPPVVIKPKTYVAWREEEGVKLAPGILDEALLRAGPIKMLKESGPWIEAEYADDKEGKRIRSVGADELSLAISGNGFGFIPKSLSAVSVGRRQIVFVTQPSKDGQGSWPTNPMLALDMRRNKSGEYPGLVSLLWVDSGVGPLVEYRFSIPKEIVNAYESLVSASGKLDSSSLTVAVGNSLDLTRRFVVLVSDKNKPHKLADLRGVSSALGAYEANLKRLNRGAEYNRLELDLRSRLNALKVRIGLPIIRNEDAVLKEIAAFNLIDYDSNRELVGRINEVILGKDYGSISLPADPVFTLDAVVKYADGLYSRALKPEKEVLKPIVDSLNRIAPRDAAVDVRMRRSKEWATAIREAILEADKAEKAYGDAKKSTQDYDELNRDFGVLNQYWSDVWAGQIMGEIYIITESGARVKLGKIVKDSAK